MINWETAATYVARETAPIYGKPHHRNQRREPQIPNKTTAREALFLSRGTLVFRPIGSGRTRRSMNG